MKLNKNTYKIGDVVLFCNNREKRGLDNAYHLNAVDSEDCIILYKEELLEILKSIEEFEAGV